MERGHVAQAPRSRRRCTRDCTERHRRRPGRPVAHPAGDARTVAGRGRPGSHHAPSARRLRRATRRTSSSTRRRTGCGSRRSSLHSRRRAPTTRSRCRRSQPTRHRREAARRRRSERSDRTSTQLDEISWNGWSAWVAAGNGSWYDAGVTARQRMAAAGFDAAAGDTWAVNELSSAVRTGTGAARQNALDFLRGLASDGVKGVVFVQGIGQSTADTTTYKLALQSWLERQRVLERRERLRARLGAGELRRPADLRRRRHVGRRPPRPGGAVPRARARAGERGAHDRRRGALVPRLDLRRLRQRRLGVAVGIRLDCGAAREHGGLRFGSGVRSALARRAVGRRPVRLRVVAEQHARLSRTPTSPRRPERCSTGSRRRSATAA